ncbi:fatty acyl-CoA reductase 1 [Cephus cinctus]|uniref:Fatty acyl-CoA reductase n=1 Tax=Cephus cinctus TaxID=211228 RepID=A0AAJ7C5E1_CEPCN|nr:fatty acyl-CoA reductase 1 [Cephus cinctus]
MTLCDWYSDREILLTGVTSELGRALLEKLLRSFPRVKVYVILRSKNGRDKSNRIKAIFASPGYGRLLQDEPNAISRVKPFEGNLLYNGLGLAKADRTALTNVTVVLHAAGPHDAVFEFAQELPAVSVVGAASSIFRHKGQITESLQNEYIPEIPLCLIRVPLLGPAWKEPMPGHVGILRGATALMVGAGYALCRSELPAELIPIDLAVNTMLVAVYQRETREHKDSSTTVYNATTIGCTWGELINKAQRANRNFAYPSFGIPGITSLVLLHRIVVFLLEWLPSVICDTILSLFGGKNRILEEHLRIRNALQTLEPILLRSWPVERNRIHLLQRQLSLEEQEAFPVCVNIDVETYVLCAAAATRKHCSDDRNSRIIKNFKWFSLAFIIFAIFLLLCK